MFTLSDRGAGPKPQLSPTPQSKIYGHHKSTFFWTCIMCVLVFSYSFNLVSCSVSANDRFNKCKHLALELATKMANVVVSGTVKKLVNDELHSTGDNRMFTGEVEIKRVFKGDRVVNSVAKLTPGLLRQYKTVTVEGFGEPSICDSRVRERETKIFLLSFNGDGSLHLNASIVALSLQNLDYVDAIIHDVPFVTEKPKEISPCYLYFCPFGASCHVNESTNVPVCVCEQRCSKIFAPVCGSDGITYSNLCLLEKAMCVHNKKLRIVTQGQCGTRNPCEGQVCKFGAECMPSIDGTIARCQCPLDCPSYGDSIDSKPVCGNDGKDHANLCELRKTACYKLEDIRVKYYGKCDPCEGITCESPKVCQVNAQREPECRCSYICPSETSLVCGSDGKTYTNQCYLTKQACKSRKEIRLLYNGKCSPENNPCNKIRCGPEEECSIDRTGKAACICPPVCEPILRRVCGNDSTTYDNECELRRRSCQEKIYVVVKHPGHCGPDFICQNHFCDYGAVCTEHNGKPVCQCPQCTEEYNPVCGENGITYENECKLRQENCQREENIKIRKQGSCDGCGQQRCEFYAVCESLNGKPRCICPTSCVKVDSPVCGNDGVTYANECELRVESCRQKKFLTIASAGSCDKCRGVHCEFNANCENGICVCPTLCPTVHEPVCGSDEQTYINECEMRKYSCDQRVFIEVAKTGGCDRDALPSSGEICHCNSIGSYSTTCDPHTRQCTCKPGVGGKRCDRCEIGYWGLHKIAESGNAGCVPCSCNKMGSHRDDCDQMTGRCMCKPHIMGMKCDMCQNGNLLGPAGCLGPVLLDSCDELVCDHGAICQEDEDGNPICVCEYTCDTKSQSSDNVCGTDGQNYGSQCQLELFGCRMQKDISVAYSGSCKGAPPTPLTTTSPVTKSRKTTRDIDVSEDSYTSNNHSNSRVQQNLEREGIKCSGSNIDDLCLSSEDCCPEFSQCRNGLCYCIEGRIPSVDNTQCYEAKPKSSGQENKTSNACAINPCVFGQCVLDDLLGYRCVCPLGKSGSRCERDITFMVPSFSGRSSLELKKIDKASQDLSIEISFSTLNRNGIILFNAKFKNGSGDFVSLAVKDGFIEFKYDLGAGPAVIRSQRPVELIKSHKVIARRQKETGMLSVDGDETVTGSSPSTHTSLELDHPLILGFIPEGTKEIYDKVGVNLGLVGCIHSLRAGSYDDLYTYNLALYDSYPDIQKGADITECGTNPCKSMPCMNGGTCLVLDAQIFECRCKIGYEGLVCEQVVNPCASKPCQYGGTCIPMTGPDSFFCQCAQGREGLQCERESMPEVFVPQFTGDSYLEMPLEEKLSTSVSITVWFKSMKPDGVLFFVTQNPGGQGDFLALNLEQKKLVFSFYLGSGLGLIESKKHIHLDKWHKVTVKRNGKTGEMSVDGHTAVTGEASGSASILNIDNRSLFVGGFRQKEDLPPRASIKTGFTGAIQRIIINGRTIDGLMSSALTMRNISTYNGPPCNVNPCLNGGVCVPLLNLADCRCPTHFIGERCEQRYEQVNRDKPVKFDGLTFLHYPNEISHKQEGQQSNNFTVKFRTSQPDGILLLQTAGETTASDYLSVAVQGEQLDLSYNLGKQDPDKLFIVRSTVKVADGKWHTARILRKHQQGSIQVDDEEPVIDNSEQGTQQLDTDGFLWVGGRSNIPWGLPVTNNFVGCIEYVEVNGQRLHFIEDHSKHSTTITFCT